MKIFVSKAALLTCLMLSTSLFSLAQNQYPASGNAIINDLRIGKYGSALSGDPDPFTLYSASGDHDLILFGSSSSSTLHLRLFDGDLKFGVNETPNAIITNSGTAYFSGSVGIGVSSPTSELSVNGTIDTKEILVETSGWPDYVFGSGHELMKLVELKAYITEHNHLPGIPAAEKVAREGQNLGLIQAKLLEKIEELTLHIIRQQEEIDALKEAFAQRGESPR